MQHSLAYGQLMCCALAVLWGYPPKELSGETSAVVKVACCALLRVLAAHPFSMLRQQDLLKYKDGADVLTVVVEAVGGECSFPLGSLLGSVSTCRGLRSCRH